MSDTSETARDEFGHYGDGRGVDLARDYLARHGTPARDLGLCNGVDSCEHGRAWNAGCERCAAGQLADVVGLWSSPRGSAGSCRRSVRLVWPELGERLDALADRDGGDPS